MALAFCPLINDLCRDGCRFEVDSKCAIPEIAKNLAAIEKRLEING